MVRAAPVVAAIVARQHGSGDGEGQDGTGDALEKTLGVHEKALFALAVDRLNL